MTTRAVLFDLGNTLVAYYSSTEFPGVLRNCLKACGSTLGLGEDQGRDMELFERAMLLNQERTDCAVRPLEARLEALFGAYRTLDEPSRAAIVAAFMEPIFSTARLDPQAVPVLQTLREAGIKTAIVSNSPWGSPAAAWRNELARHGLLDRVDATVFCTDVGWRKPHRAPFDRALSLLDVAATDALFVGDDHRWDVLGAQNAGLRPVLLQPEGTESVTDQLTIQNLRDILPLSRRHHDAG